MWRRGGERRNLLSPEVWFGVGLERGVLLSGGGVGRGGRRRGKGRRKHSSSAGSRRLSRAKRAWQPKVWDVWRNEICKEL